MRLGQNFDVLGGRAPNQFFNHLVEYGLDLAKLCYFRVSASPPLAIRFYFPTRLVNLN